MNRVFVLGAGASKAIRNNAPLMPELVGEVVALCFRVLDGTERDAKTPIIRQCSEILLFVAQLYTSPLNAAILSQDNSERYDASRDQVQILKSEERLPNLEDILSQIDYAIAQDRPISQYWSIDTLRQLRRSLIYAITRVIRDRVETPSINDLSEELEQRLLGSLLGDTIISLNYDLVMDNAISGQEGFTDYGMPVRGIFDKQKQGHPYQRYPSSGETNITLYKLHGSLNWLYCPRCRQIDITQSEKGAVRYIFERLESRLSHCPVCNVSYQPLIITPTFLKSYDNDLIRQLWNNAEAALEVANEIIFVGYSLPDADVILRSMFSRAVATNRIRRYQGQTPNGSSSNRRGITLVDYVIPDNVESQKKANETRSRYERLFGKIESSDYFQGGLKEFIERRC